MGCLCIGTIEPLSLKLAVTGASYEFLPALDELSDELLAVAKDEKKKLLPVQQIVIHNSGLKGLRVVHSKSPFCFIFRRIGI